MAQDSYTVVTGQSWGQRLKGALAGIVVGLGLVALCFVMLFWNEGRAVERRKTLKEGAGAVVSVSADRVDPAREGALVHLSGRADTGETLTDDTFGVSAPALRLERKVEMYQWQEQEESTTDKKVGGGSETTTTYTYETAWSDSPVDSSRFARSEGHENPGSFPWSQREVTAERVSLGGYRLSPGLVGKIERWQPLALSSLDPLPEDLRERARLHDGGLYFGDGAPASPQVGDVRVAFRVVEPTDVSVVAQQTGDTFRPFAAEAGGTIELLELGTVNADQMFAAAQRRNTLFTWGLRLAGFLLMAMGFVMVLRPLSVAADVLPFLGSLVGAGTGFVAFLLAGFFSLVTIAMAWIFYRPLLGGALLALAVVAAAWLVRRTRRARTGAVQPASGAAPPPPPLPPQGSPPPAPPVAG